MADEVTVRARLLGGAKFNAETARIAHGIDDIGDKAEKSAAKLALLKVVNTLSGPMGAMAKRGDETASSLRDMTSGVRGIWMAAALASPALVGLGGAIVAVGGSAGAAMLGGGAVAGAGIGALVAGLLGIVLVGKQTATNLRNVTRAVDAHNLAVKMYGRGSREAQDAQRRLNMVLRESGGRPMLNAIRGWRTLRREFKEMTGPAQASMAAFLSGSVKRAKKWLPMLSRETNKSSRVMRISLMRSFDALSSREMRRHFQSFGGTFRRALGPGLRGGTSLFISLVRILRQAAPYVVSLARGLEHLGESTKKWTSNTGRVRTVVRGLVSHFTAWFGLARSLGALLVTIFSGGAGHGKRMVQTLSLILTRWNAWLNTREGQRSMRRFFDDAKVMTERIVGGLGRLSAAFFKVLQAMGPGFLSSWDALAGILGLFGGRMTTIVRGLELLGPLAGPATTALIAWKGAGLAFAALAVPVRAVGAAYRWSAATIAALKMGMGAMKAVYIAQTGVTNASSLAVMRHAAASKLSAAATKAQTVAQVALNIVMRANPIILVVTAILALGAAFILAYRKVRWFRTGVDAVWKFFKTHWHLIVPIIAGPIGLAATLIIKNWDRIKSGATGVYTWVTGKFSAMVGFVKGLPGKVAAAATGIWNGIKSGLESVITWITEKINSIMRMIETAKNKITSLPGSVASGIGGAVNPFDGDIVPFGAKGGVFGGTPGTQWVTGEAGPEINTTLPGGRVLVRPLTSMTGKPLSSVAISPRKVNRRERKTSTTEAGKAMRALFEIHTHTHLDGREIDRSVTKVNRDSINRR